MPAEGKLTERLNNKEVFLQVLTNAREINDRVDAQLAQSGLVTDTAQLKNLGAADSACTQNDFLGCRHSERTAVYKERNAGSSDSARGPGRRGVVLTSGLAIRPVDLGDLSASQDEQIVTARRLSNVDVLT